MNRRLLASPVFVLILFAAPARAATADWKASSRPTPLYETPLPRDPLKTTVHRLPNGLTVYLSPNAQEPRVTAWIMVRAGGAQDPADSTGIAHYLEHMLFKGSRRIGTTDYEKEAVHLDRIRDLYDELFQTADPESRRAVYARIDSENRLASAFAIPNELDKAYKAMGVQGVNAFTTNEATVYVGDIPKNRLEAWARLEGERFRRPVFRLFQSEIEAVYEEKNKYADSPSTVLHEALMEALYGTHAYARPILGSIEHLKNPSLVKMYRFYATYYVPNNMAVALSGDFDRAEALGVIGKFFGSWEPGPIPEVRRSPEPPPSGVTRVSVRYEAEEQLLVAYPAVGNGHPDAEALMAMDMLVDNAESGLINLRLNQAQRVKRAGSGMSRFNGAGAWLLYAQPKEGQTLEEAEALLMEAVEAVKKGEFTDEDLAAIIQDFEIHEKVQLESNEERAKTMMKAFTQEQDWADRVDRLRRLRGVGREDVLRVAAKYLGETRVVVFRRRGKPEIPSIAKPEFSKVELDPSRRSAFVAEVLAMPVRPIEPRWAEEGRDYFVSKAPFGRIVSVKNPVNDLFSIGFRFDRGSRNERTLCAALSLLEKAGAGEMTAERFKRRLYSLGVKFTLSCGPEESGVSLSGLEARLPEALELMRLRFEKPSVAEGTLEKMVAIQIGQHKDNKIDPRSIFRALAEYAQRGPDSDVLNELNDGELRALTEDGLKDVIRGFFDHERRVAYVGSRPASEIAALLGGPGKDFRPAPNREPRRYASGESPRVLFVHRDMVQSQVGMFAPDGELDNDRSADYKFYSQYMGGGASSVVFQEVREARSLAYFAWAGYLPGAWKGDENRLLGILETQADKTIEAARLLSGLLRELPASSARFEETKKAIEEGYRAGPIMFRDLPGAVMTWRDQGLAGDPRPRNFKKTLSYELDDLVGFAARFKEKPLTIFVLGNRDRVDLDALRALGDFSEKGVDHLFPY